MSSLGRPQSSGDVAVRRFGQQAHHAGKVQPTAPGVRADGVSRAFPPAGKALVTDSDAESLVSCRFRPG